MVEDNPERSFRLPPEVAHVSWAEIEDDLGDDAWVIPRRTGAVRNYGFLLAAATSPDLIVTLDDDCRPNAPCPFNHFLNTHRKALTSSGDDVRVLDTMFQSGHYRYDIRPRGFPKDRLPWCVVVNHGLWNYVPDLDGQTQLRVPDYRTGFTSHSLQVPPGILFPMSSMNVAFRPEALPLMYLLPMGEGQPYNRFDDIWCGWIMKKICDHLGWAVRSGEPFVYHSRASDAKRNAEVEADGIVENEKVWRVVSDLRLGESLEIVDCLEQIYSALAYECHETYWKHTRHAHRRWVRLAGEATS